MGCTYGMTVENHVIGGLGEVRIKSEFIIATTNLYGFDADYIND